MIPSDEISPHTDSDSPWKELIEAFFPEFIEFFLPEAFTEINWSRGYQFLDNELQQITADAELGRRTTDKLIRIWKVDNIEAWVLVHVEVQSTSTPDFAERMFVYRYRIYDRFRKPVASVAILADESLSWRPSEFRQELWGSEDYTRFRSIKLLDYQSQEETLLAATNPFAMAVVAHLRALATKKDRILRKQWKLELVKLLYEKGYETSKIVNLFRFIDWLLSLPQQLTLDFWQELAVYEQEKKMPYITSVERIGIEKGQQQGLQQGLEQGLQQGLKQEAALIIRMLERKVGDLSVEQVAQVQSLPKEQLETLGLALLDFEGISDLRDWLGSLR
ncbi:DUF4351 domain-containing protein [Thermosynechococcaceae cyanobacterium BACA0444]|uniref:DUF4351 domain-containing protein n=1 Tax=Pseudocalidococcus azoricus BACA0444 TaxID=2918990 RepID=A0AAE4FPC5_9CYAN|nr:DUF4351 domain-containing protein [Pseudocalidococcus azoricus]MDS3859238.1 DUF4351 domain-containing protein [Pseudocalidococcus azoricus BACA0444]